MRPFTVLIGIVLGSAASITFGLAAVLIVFCVLAGQHPDLSRELPRLLMSLAAFGLLTTASAGSFLGEAKARPWRGWAHAALLRLPLPGRPDALAAPSLSRREDLIIRRNLRLRAALALAAWLSACATHKGPPPSTDIDDTGFRDAVRVLAADDFEGRRPGTRGEEKTVAFLTAQFRKLNLKPGTGDSYVQQVPLVEILAADDATLTVAGRGGSQALHYRKDMLIWTKRAVPAAQLAGSELVFVGYGIVAPEYQWNDYAQLDVRGKTVLVLVGDPGYRSKDPRLFKGAAMSGYGRWTYKVEEAVRQGAAGVLLIHDAAASGYGWSAVENTWSGPQLELASSDNAAHASIEGWISADAAHSLFALAGLDYEAQSTAAAHPGFRASAMGLKVDAQLHNSIRRFNSANLIAVLPGAQHKHEYVIYTAHWDGLGRDAGGAVLNGAVDDATGVAGLLMLAQSFSRTRPPPDRSIVFIAFTAEESGLLGSQYYVENPVLPLSRTAAVLNLDGLHIGGRTRDVIVFGAGNSELEEYVRGAALLQGRELRPDPHPEQGLYFRSDQYNFARHGVPAVYATAGLDDAARGPKWGEAQIDDYMAHRYRQSGDKYREDWDVRGAVDDLTLYYAVGDRVARTHRFPRWYPSSEFSAAHSRDRDAAVE